jgi:hypothetical protein
VIHYEPGPESPPWPTPASLYHPAAAADPTRVQNFNDAFGCMRSSAFESFRSCAPARSDALTLPPYPIHRTMNLMWLIKFRNSMDGYGTDNRSEIDSEYGDAHDDSHYIETGYMTKVRETLSPSCNAPMMLGHCVLPEHIMEEWKERYDNFYDHDLKDSLLIQMYDEGMICLLQVMPHGPEKCLLAFFATEEELRERRWNKVKVLIVPMISSSDV